MRQILIKINLYGKKGHPRDTTEHTYKNRIYEQKETQICAAKQKPTLQNKK